MSDLENIESDFWKDIFVHMQHKNMMRSNGEKLYLDQCDMQFNRFQMAHPDIQAEITNAETYKTWEIFITQTIKLRLYIQNQIKASLLQKEGNYFTKVCDAKFQNNPFPEIEEILKNRDSYTVQIERDKNLEIRNRKMKQIAYQFIKAELNQRFKNFSEVLWELNEDSDGFILTVTQTSKNKIEKYKLGIFDFVDVIKNNVLV